MKLQLTKKDIHDEILWTQNPSSIQHQNPSSLAKSLIRANQAKNEQLVNNISDGLIDLRNAIIKKERPKNKNPNKMIDTVEKIIDFNKKQKCKGLQIINS